MSERTNPSPAPGGIHVLAKPMGPVCDIRCDYCFYLEKRALFGGGEDYRMPDGVLAAFIEQYVRSQPTPVVEFVWHGGEPTLRGLDFFRRVVALQQPFRVEKQIKNALQTNGLRLTDEWCAFFKEHDFFIGISLDGPRDIHDRYRKSRDAGPTFDGVMKGLRLLQKHGVDFNVLACVGRDTAYRPLDVYHFFKDEGVAFIQFTPIIERQPDAAASAKGLWLSGPSALDGPEPNAAVTTWSVEPERYGDFLIAICEEWVRKDVGTVFVMNFEWAWNAWIGQGSPVCVFARQCGRAVAMEHDGTVYACDHYVYPEYRLGNVRTAHLGEMIERSVASGFGPHKETSLPRWCRECDVVSMCWGGCPKHRFATSLYGEPGLHYLCAGYKKFFTHIRKYLRPMTQLLENGLPPSLIMKAFDGPLVVPLPPPGRVPAPQRTAAEPAVLRDGDRARFIRVDGLHKVRFAEIFLAGREAKTGKLVAACYNTSLFPDAVPASRDTAPQAWAEGLDFDRIKSEFGVLGASFNGPKLWMPDWVEVEYGVERAFNGRKFPWVAQLQMGDNTGGVSESTPYKPVRIARNSGIGWNKGTTALLLDDAEGNTWIMKGFQLGLKPKYTYEEFVAAGQSQFKKLPPGWKFRVKKLERDLVERPEGGVATIMPDEFFNLYDKTGPGMTNYKP